MSLYNRIENGGFTDFEGNPLALGYLLMQLSHDEQYPTGTNVQVVAGIKIRVPLDSNGNVAGTVSVAANDQMLPASSYYIVMAYAADGTEAWSNPQYWQILSSPSPFDLGTLVPANPPMSGLSPISPAILKNPAADQTISAFNLLPANGNTTQSLGSTSAPWDAVLLNETIKGTLTDGAASVGTNGQVLSSTGSGVAWETLTSSVAFGSITSGTNTTAAMVVGTGSSLTTSGSGSINASKISGIAVSGTPSAGQVLTATSSSAADWASPSAGAFSTITSGTNTAATMTVGTGGSITTSGSGVVNANELTGITISGTPSTGQVLTATSSSAADWATPGLTVAGGGFTKIQAGSASVNNGGTVSFPATFTTLIAVTIGNFGGSANIASASTSGFVMNTSSSPQTIDWIAVGT